MKLKDYISPSVCNKILSQVLDVQQVKHDDINANIKDTINQCVIKKATWGLDDWEEEYGITTKLTDTLENRRSRALARKRGTRTTTKGVIKEICNSFVDNTNVIEHSAEYYFELILESYSGFHNFLEDLMEIIEDLKPAHLGVDYELKATAQSNIYMGFIGFDGEVVNTYPWTPNDIESKLDYYMPTFQPSSLENINTYPKEVS